MFFPLFEHFMYVPKYSMYIIFVFLWRRINKITEVQLNPRFEDQRSEYYVTSNA